MLLSVQLVYKRVTIRLDVIMATQASKQEYSEPEYAKKQDRTKVPYYHVNIEHKIPVEVRDAVCMDEIQDVN